VDEEYLSFEENFMTFGNMSKKLWPNMLFFSMSGQFGQIKNHFFQKQKFGIGILDLYINGKLLFIPFCSMSQML